MLNRHLTQKALLITATTFVLLDGYRANAGIISVCSATLQNTNTGVLTDTPCTVGYILGPADTLTTIGNTGIRVLMQNDVSFVIRPFFPEDVVESFSVFSQVDAYQYFVITGGTGVGTFTGMGISDGDDVPFAGVSRTHSFDSNFLPQPDSIGVLNAPLTFSFTFDQPFVLFYTDRVTFSGGGRPVIFGASGTEWNAFYLKILDSNGNPVPNAVVQATSLPEPSTWIFLVAGSAFCSCLARYHRGKFVRSVRAGNSFSHR